MTVALREDLVVWEDVNHRTAEGAFCKEELET